MRCLSCDCLLSLAEDKRKSEVTGEYYQLCDNCLSTTDILFVPDTPMEDGVDEDESESLGED